MKHIKTFRIFESMINRDKDVEVFNYKSLTNDAWRPLIQFAQKCQGINFDLENNDSMGEKKTLFIKKNLRKDQPVKYEFNIELFRAGGDWEIPVMYFKVEFTHQHLRMQGYEGKTEYAWDAPEVDKDGEPIFKKGLHKCYVVIPGPDINHLDQTKDNKYTAYHDDPDKKNIKITEEDKKKAWKWVEDLLTKLVEDRHEMLDDPNSEYAKDIASVGKAEDPTNESEDNKSYEYKGYYVSMQPFEKFENRYFCEVYKDKEKKEGLMALKGPVSLEQGKEAAELFVDGTIEKQNEPKLV